MPFIAETDSEVPIAFEPHDGTWPGGAGTRLNAYGRFEEPPAYPATPAR